MKKELRLNTTILFNLAPIILLFSIGLTKERRSQVLEFDNFINRSLNTSKIAGMGIAIISKDSVLYKKGYGYSDLKKKKKFTTNTIMNIASISKTFIGVSIMRLVENNQINLDDNINKFLTFHIYNPHHPESIITLRSLMSHTSGIIDNQEIYLSSYHYGNDSPIELGHFIENYLSKNGEIYSENNFSNKDPGKEFIYSNIGAALTGHIVEIITGKPFNIFTKEIIFNPLGMSNTCWFLSEMNRADHAKIYKLDSKENKLNEIELYGLTTYPDGGLRTSVNDLAKYFLYFIKKNSSKEKKIISDKKIIEMFSPDHFDFYSNFWNIGKTIGHGGGDPGVSTGMFYLKEDGIGYIFFINTSDYLKIDKLEETIINFGKYLKNLN